MVVCWGEGKDFRLLHLIHLLLHELQITDMQEDPVGVPTFLVNAVQVTVAY